MRASDTVIASRRVDSFRPRRLLSPGPGFVPVPNQNCLRVCSICMTSVCQDTLEIIATLSAWSSSDPRRRPVAQANFQAIAVFVENSAARSLPGFGSTSIPAGGRSFAVTMCAVDKIKVKRSLSLFLTHTPFIFRDQRPRPKPASTREGNAKPLLHCCGSGYNNNTFPVDISRNQCAPPGFCRSCLMATTSDHILNSATATLRPPNTLKSISAPRPEFAQGLRKPCVGILKGGARRDIGLRADMTAYLSPTS